MLSAVGQSATYSSPEKFHTTPKAEVGKIFLDEPITELMTIQSPVHSLSSDSTFVVSLDFELYWGMFDQIPLTPYYQDVLMRTREEVIPRLLELFDQYEIHTTWASVGLLFFEDRSSLAEGLPTLQTTYDDDSLSAYQHLLSVGENEEMDPFHYAPSIVKQIQSYPHQEIGSHSFSHYYCMEEGQSPEMFEADIRAWINVANQYGIEAKSICFARNQYAAPYLAACNALKIDAYRGNENTWFYRPDSYKNEHVVRKIFRWLDTYFPITRHHCTSMEQLGKQSPYTYSEKLRSSSSKAEMTSTKSSQAGQNSSGGPYNIQSSRFLRAYSSKLSLFEPLKLRRILSGMTHASKENKIYHLWWHPQDFGENTEKNFEMLEQILAHYARLHHRSGMRSLNMAEIASLIRNGPNHLYTNRDSKEKIEQER